MGSRGDFSHRLRRDQSAQVAAFPCPWSGVARGTRTLGSSAAFPTAHMVMSFTEKGRKGGQTAPTFALPPPPDSSLRLVFASALSLRVAIEEALQQAG
jgi:hypothetical protein